MRYGYGLSTFWTDNETPSLLCPLVNSFHNVDQLLLVFKHPVEFIIVTSTKIAHHVFVPIEEHYGHRIIEFVHCIELRNLIDIAEIDDCKV